MRGAKPEKPIPSSSLREYWNTPTGFRFSASSEPRRKRTSRAQEPSLSLWDTNTLQSLAVPQTPREQVNEPTAFLSHPFEGVIVTENRRQLADRLEQYGVSSLSTAELLSLILRTGASSERRIRRVQEMLSEQSVQQLLQLDVGTFSQEYGLGQAKAAQVIAVLEVARRLLLAPSTDKYQIRSSTEAARLVIPDMAFLDHEEMRVLLLDTKNYVVANLLYSKGTINSSVLRAAEIYRPAVTRNCPHVIVCHNHPSGDPAPSPEDLAVTQQLVEAGKLLDIDLLDHLIIGHHHRFTSLKEHMAW